MGGFRTGPVLYCFVCLLTIHDGIKSYGYIISIRIQTKQNKIIVNEQKSHLNKTKTVTKKLKITELRIENTLSDT